MVKIKIVRHSERLDYTYPLYWLICFGYHWSDSPLTTNGYKMVKKKSKKIIDNNFNPKYIYTSPYTRTMGTSTEIQKLFYNSQILIEPLLSEYQPYFAHCTSIYPNGIPTIYNDMETGFTYPETEDNFYQRVKFIVQKIVEKHDDDLILVTHGEFIKKYINYLQKMYPEIVLDPGSTPYLTVLSFECVKNQDGFIIVRESIKIE